jgi:FKBP-type peptidyl-prolyl cis-trans isomerase SlpA
MDELIASSNEKIGPTSTVTLHFSLLQPGGKEIDTTRNGKPATFTMGDGSLLPGFEAVLLGKQAGFAEQIVLPATEAFGEKNPANVQLISRARFAQMDGEQPLEEGLVVSFQAPDGELPGVVVAVYEDTVKVDFNHPLSGTDIIFDVSVLSVQDTASA